MPHQHLLILFLLLLLLLPLTLASPNLIITGAGTAGCALAALLCRAHPSLKITLLERGRPLPPTPLLQTRSPRLVFRSWFNPLVTQTIPNPAGIAILTGANLGGSSSMNGMQWTVPLNGTTARWNLGLRPRRIRRLYAAAFDTLRPRLARGRHAYETEYIQAAREVGFTEKGPFGLGNEDAVFRNLLAISKRGRRTDSCWGYLRTVLRKGAVKNLKLVQGARVRKVLIRKRKTGLKAVGVVYDAGKGRHVLRGRVILSAGPYGSPQLLQLSGIGPRDVLEKAGIRVRKELPVGERTVARPAGLVISLYTGVPLDPANNGTIVNSTRTLQEWREGKGTLTVPPYAFNGRVEDVGYFAAGTVFGPTIGLDVPQMWSICLTNAISEGFLQVKSADPDEPPEVELSILKERRDLRGMTRCMKRMKDIHAAFPKSFGLVDIQPIDLSEKSVRESTAFAFHYVGGCRVGDVVDRRFRVKGVQDLWVVDASVLNSLPVSAGPMAAVYMLAHAAAERIGEAVAM